MTPTVQDGQFDDILAHLLTGAAVPPHGAGRPYRSAGIVSAQASSPERKTVYGAPPGADVRAIRVQADALAEFGQRLASGFRSVFQFALPLRRGYVVKLILANRLEHRF